MSGFTKKKKKPKTLRKQRKQSREKKIEDWDNLKMGVKKNKPTKKGDQIDKEFDRKGRKNEIRKKKE